MVPVKSRSKSPGPSIQERARAARAARGGRGGKQRPSVAIVPRARSQKGGKFQFGGGKAKAKSRRRFAPRPLTIASGFSCLDMLRLT